MKIVISAMVLALTTLGAAAQEPALIPRPLKMEQKEGRFDFKSSPRIVADPVFKPAAGLLGEYLRLPAGTGAASAGSIVIVRGKENGYQLKIEQNRIVLSARQLADALDGVNTLRQLYLLNGSDLHLPAMHITDSARFGYRGMHLDVSRHFYPVEFIYKFIDLMALYKFNTFHWHLTDGAGWRLEINKYPELTKTAAWRTHNYCMDWWANGRQYLPEGNANAYGGYYTQEQAKAVVAYAAKRGITVIPEIEMPGHSEEVLAVYPHLSCTGKPYENSEFCLGNDSTFTFLEDVLQEVMAIFPSRYIHIGGDEASKKAWKNCPKCQQRIKKEGLKDEEELQSYGVRRMEKFLVGKKRKLLGWDEILEGGLAPEATVMSWRGEKGGITAAEAGHDVIMTPGGYCYFDSYQADPATEPPAIGGFLPLSKVYSYNPVPAELHAAKAHHVLGAQANIWTEYMPTTYQVEYMAFPRMLALAEVLWTPLQLKNWDDFKTRLQAHYPLLQKKNVNYYRPSYQLQIKTDIRPQTGSALITFDSEQYRPLICYTLDGSTPTAASAQYAGPFEIKGSAKIKAAIFRDTAMQGQPASLPLDFHKALGKKVTYNEPYYKGYAAQNEATLVNGYRGSLTYGDGQWQGFLNKGLDVTIDLEQATPLNSLSVGFMQLTGPGVYMPPAVEVYTSNDGQQFTLAQKIDNDVPPTHNKLIFKDFVFDLKGASARYIRVKAKTQKGFIFTDEIIVY
ncbi:beta-N-acetylhexosaminidase [Chitinophaga lutea]|uniref:beta-N-acetylhexosaminidase n=1 Tax=Chitinophaga lutea TaxID=2488634 RepID=A0A3N4PW40_9BACT|nr:family 20 glycosylhydrolase [Chitinophaga lutea]RPE09311.1 beta-N-acetylhexosaminidase [Chitinophaga lutea]